MGQDIISGLFGASPWQVQQQQQQMQNQQSQQFANMNATQRGVAGMYQAGGQLGGMLAEGMGMVNPAVQEAQNRQQALSGLDVSDPKALLQRALQTQDPQLKMRLVMMARQMDAERQKQMLEERKMQLGERRQEFQEGQMYDLKLQQLEAMKVKEEQLLELKRQGQISQDQYRDSMIELRKKNLALQQSRVGAGAPKNLTREARLKYELENGLIDQSTYDAAMAATPGGKAETAAKTRKEALKQVETKLKVVSDTVDEALKQTGFFTTGLTGSVLSNVPGTAAFDMEGTIDTIKANLGFNELQAMRNASPTGGALGQVAVRELDMLQSTLASLKIGQSKDKQIDSLNKIKKHYDAWRATLNQAGESVEPSKPQTSGGWSIRPKE